MRNKIIEKIKNILLNKPIVRDRKHCVSLSDDVDFDGYNGIIYLKNGDTIEGVIGVIQIGEGVFEYKKNGCMYGLNLN